MTPADDLFAVIVGTGFSGLGAAIELRKAGIENFVMLERAATLGGTWRDNSYPGCACDVPSHLYSFSFAPKHDWSRTFAGHDEIRAYVDQVADDYDLRRHALYEREVASATWDETAARWRVRTRSGERWSAQVLILGTGALSNPEIPPLPGVERFRGPRFHSAQWRHDLDLKGMRVAVVGTGASAIQFVPRIQPAVRSLFLLQRTAPWVVYRPDRAYRAFEKAAFRRVPGVRWIHRQVIYWHLEGRVLAFTRFPWLMKVVEGWGKRHIARGVKDPALRARLTPTFTPGCKRLLMSNDYYPALAQPNVEVISDPIAGIGESTISFASGRTVEVDAIIYGTGFRVHDHLGGLSVIGRQGVDLRERWSRDGASAHRGTMIAGFPNLFMMTGPNTGLGHNSIVVMIEAQMRYLATAIRLLREKMRDGAAALLEPTPSAQSSYNVWLAGRTARTVWTSGCRSWYLDPRGRNTVLWTGFASSFYLRTARFRPREHALVAEQKKREP